MGKTITGSFATTVTIDLKLFATLVRHQMANNHPMSSQARVLARALRYSYEDIIRTNPDLNVTSYAQAGDIMRVFKRNNKSVQQSIDEAINIERGRTQEQIDEDRRIKERAERATDAIFNAPPECLVYDPHEE